MRFQRARYPRHNRWPFGKFNLPVAADRQRSNCSLVSASRGVRAIDRTRDIHMNDVIYADRVVGILAAEFNWDQTTQDICLATLTHKDRANGFPPFFEFICDDPGRANWRLKSNRENRKTVRLSYYGFVFNPASEARAQMISRRLVEARTRS